MQGCRRKDEPILVRIKGEDRPPDEIARSALDLSDIAVAVLDGCRKLALLERGPHPVPFALRNATREHEGLGAPADAAELRAHERVPGRRDAQRLLDEGSLAWSRHPESAGLLRRHAPFSTFGPRDTIE